MRHIHCLVCTASSVVVALLVVAICCMTALLFMEAAIYEHYDTTSGCSADYLVPGQQLACPVSVYDYNSLTATPVTATSTVYRFSAAPPLSTTNRVRHTRHSAGLDLTGGDGYSWSFFLLPGSTITVNITNVNVPQPKGFAAPFTVMVLDKASYSNWDLKRPMTTPLYNSTLTNSHLFSVTIPNTADTYYVVVNNRMNVNSQNVSVTEVADMTTYDLDDTVGLVEKCERPASGSCVFLSPVMGEVIIVKQGALSAGYSQFVMIYLVQTEDTSTMRNMISTKHTIKILFVVLVVVIVVVVIPNVVISIIKCVHTKRNNHYTPIVSPIA